MIKKWRKGLAIQLSMLLFVFAGCGNRKEAVDAGANIELLEPIGATVSYETAACRNIYNVVTYTAGVYPVVTEYAFEDTVQFAGYSVLPGEEVGTGDTLLAADVTALEEQIADRQEALAEKEAAHAEYVADMEEAIADAAEETAYRKAYLDCLSEENQDSLYVMIQGNYRMALYKEEMLRKELEQNIQLYELEHAYEQQQLAEVLEERNRGVLTAAEDGVVVSCGFFKEGDTLQENVPVIAVANMQEKMLKCDYISPAQIAKADKIYACVDGIKYEVAYQKMDSSEYTRMTEAGSALYSTFLFMDDAVNVKIGDVGAVVLEFNSREDVVTVSRAAVHKDETGSYVYVYENDEKIYTPIKTGISDGTYIEVVSGLEAGDKIMTTGEVWYGNKTAVVERGTYSTEFGGRGYLYYPDTTYVKNEIEYGTVYFEEYHVEEYGYVKKGDLIATIRVEGENAELTALQLQLTRLEERLYDYRLAWSETCAERDYAKETEAEKKVWRQRQDAYFEEEKRRVEEIEELAQLIQDMQEDYATYKIVAPRDGLVTWLGEYTAEQVLGKDCNIAGIADKESACLLVENTNQVLNYGAELDISYLAFTQEGEITVTVPGRVTSLSNPGLSDWLYSEYAVIQMMEQGEDGGTAYRYQISGTASGMENVLLVPKDAVTNIDGHLYVNVVQEDGGIVTKSFVAGGHDLYNYWVIAGLEEGMTLCYE